MNHPAPVTITMSGTYDPLLRSGVVNAQFRNDSTDAIKGRVIFVITEDSIYYEGPNGDNWHNHVPRDYLPDENGDTATILAGDSLTITQAFAIDPSWILAKCQIATWIQNDSMYADSTKEIWQAGVIDVADLPSMASEEIHGAFSSLEIAAFPNPCVDGTTFSFNLFKGLRYHINIFDVTGRNINNLNGTAKGGAESINWDGRDSNGNTLNSGIYFYQFRVNNGTSSGKIVVN